MTGAAPSAPATRHPLGDVLRSIAEDVRSVAPDRVELTDAVVTPPVRRLGQVRSDDLDVWLGTVLYHRHHADDAALVGDMLAGRSDARGIPDWEDATLASALAEADGGRVRATTGWSVVGSAPPGVVVDDGRLQLIARADQVDLEGPGRSCSLRLPVARHYLQAGWFHTSGLRGSPAGGEPGARVYLSPTAAGSPELLRTLVRSLDAAAVRFVLKVGNCADTFRRADPMVLYVERAALVPVLGLVASAIARVPGGLGPRTPGFAERLAPGVAVGGEPTGDPGRRPSLGQHRASVAARAILAGAGNGVALVDHLRASFEEAGIDPARPAWDVGDAPEFDELTRSLDV